MRSYPLLKLSKSILYSDNLFSVCRSRLIHNRPSVLSQRCENTEINSIYRLTSYPQLLQKSVSSCLTSNLVNQLSIFGLITDLTTTRLSSLYLQCHQWARSLNETWKASLYHFSADERRGNDEPPKDPFELDKLTKNLPPLLMDFIDMTTTPGPFMSIKNLYSIFFVIKPFYDPSFSYQVFLDGAKQAFCVISENLSKGETNTLEELVTPDALAAIRENIVKFSPSQLADLKVDEQDIIFWLAKDISIIERGERKFIEVTVIFHVIKGYQDKLSSREKHPFFLPDPDMTFCNYRFIREYTKGVDGEWTCNRLNHFKWGHFLKASPFAS